VNILQRLNAPFPEKISLLKSIVDTLWIAVFVVCFLYLLQPFGLYNYEGNIFLLCLDYGLITLLFGGIYQILSWHLSVKNLPSEKWTLKRWILDTLGVILFIALGNYLLGIVVIDFPFSFSQFFNMIISTMIVGSFPIIVTGLLYQVRLNTKNQDLAANINTHLSPETSLKKLVTIGQEQTMDLDIDDLLYAEAMQNYVAIIHLKNDKTEKTILRSTLSNIENQLLDTSILRCHRSFLVNINQIEKTEGNAQGLRLSLKDLTDTKVPVSRKYIPKLKEKIA